MDQNALARFADAAAEVLQLELSKESRASVIANLAVLFARADEFTAIALPDDCDPAGLLRL